MLRWVSCFVMSIAIAAAQGTITTFAGTGVAGFSGDNGPAASAAFNRPVYVHIDPSGNIYVADENNQRVRRIDPATGVITTFAGNGARAFAGDNGPAVQASLNGVNGVCSDAAGNIYLNDTGNNRIRRVDSSGVITTFAGNGASSSSGDGGPASAAGIFLPIRCAVDANGVMYIAEQGAHRIRRVAANGTITTIAGNGTRGFAGDGGPAANAILDNPTAVAVDYAGNVYFSDQGNQRIRRIAANGTIGAFAGNGSVGFSGDNGPAAAAQFNFPGGLAVDQAGNLFMTDGPNHRGRWIDRDGIIRTFAGNGTAGFSGDGGPATSASINAAFGIALDSSGAIYLADTLNNRIRRVSPLAPGSAPQFTAASVLNAASFTSGLAPGGLVTIFGRNLSPANGAVVTTQAPWPERLNGVAVTVGGFAARMYSLATFAGQEQISFQVPFEVPIAGNVNVAVDNNGSRSATVSVPLRAGQAGIFLIDGVNGAFLHPNFSVVTATNPATRGEALAAFLTGLGAVSPAVETGFPAPSQEPFARTTIAPAVTVGGLSAEVIYSGLAPGFIGLYQVNFVVPAAAPTGSVDVVATVDGAGGNVAKLEIR
ncbi:MAG: hypothetical protein KIT09_12635 [Bryobacteraceae bacterium]|nr:hypothetical protein [Bryobacteraceae bacterium]